MGFYGILLLLHATTKSPNLNILGMKNQMITTESLKSVMHVISDNET